MLIEEGKFYRTAEGLKAGPVERSTQSGYFWTAKVGSEIRIYFENGRHGGSHTPNKPGLDLVALWTDGPVREVVTTTREIVPGVYDRLEVQASTPHEVSIRLASRGGTAISRDAVHRLNPKELATLIANLTALQEVIGK